MDKRFYTRHFLAVALAMVSTTTWAQKVELKATPRGNMELRTIVGDKQQVLGYTDVPTNSDAEMPDNMKQWLQQVQRVAHYAEEHPEMTLGTSHPTGIHIEPLLGQITWGQETPFNSYIPHHYPVGCVSTAMMQVMRYYQYPEQGIGQKSLEWNKETYEADFGNTIYRWDLMPEVTQKQQLTDEQIQACSTLGYHCSVALETEWAQGGSSAYHDQIAPALIEYFGYNPYTALIDRVAYTFKQWMELLTNELSAGRPIIYRGQDGEAGHAFVVDGINEEGLFHINWGWNGNYNGYYDICICDYDPEEMPFYRFQSAIIQITPEHGVGKQYEPFKAESFMVNAIGDGGCAFQCYIENMTGRTQKGDFGYEMFCPSTNICDTIWMESGMEVPFRTSQRIQSIIPLDSLEDGIYQIRPMARLTEGERKGYVYPMLFKPSRMWLNIKIEDHKLAYRKEYGARPEFKYSNFSHEGQTISLYETTTMTVDVENISENMFVGEINMTYWDEEYHGYYTIEEIVCDDKLIHIAPGETKTVTLTGFFTEPFDWEISFMAFDNAITYAFYDDYEGKLAGEFTETSPYLLSLALAPKLLTERCEVDNEITFSLTVLNEGRPYEGQLAMLLFDSKKNPETNNLSPLLQLTADVQFEGMSRDTVTVSGVLEGLKPGKYYARPYYYKQDSTFEPLLRNGNLTAAIEVAAYPSAIETIRQDDACKEEKRYDLMGRPIKNKNAFSVWIK